MQPYCDLQHLGCNSDSLTIRPWSSPCRWRSWLHAFTVLTNRKPLGLKVTSVWAVLHIIHHQTTDIGLSWVYYWDGTNGLKVQMTVSMQLQRDTWSQPRNKGLIQQNNRSFKKKMIYFLTTNAHLAPVRPHTLHNHIGIGSRVTNAEVPTQCLQNEHAKKVKENLQRRVSQRCRDHFEVGGENQMELGTTTACDLSNMKT